MGTYNSTYIGIYLEIPFVKVEKEIITYTHPTTGVKMSKKFCPDTGVEGIEHKRTETKYSEPNTYIDDVDGLEEDMFWQPNVTGGEKCATVILNRHNKKFAHTDDDYFNYSIDSSLNIEDLISEFKVKYDEYLNYFIEKYKVVNVKYGVVNYGN
jgi:hypothetical protein